MVAVGGRPEKKWTVVDGSGRCHNAVERLAGVRRLPGRSLAALLMSSGSGEPDAVAGVHTHLFCEVGRSRAVFTPHHRLIYSPSIKPISKGGSTDVRHNYQAHKHHASYWRPLQFYDLVADPTEQVNLLDDAEHAAERARLSGLLERHMGGEGRSSECGELGVWAERGP